MNGVNIRTMPLFICSVGMAPVTEVVAMMVKAVRMRASMANKFPSRVGSRSIILLEVLVKIAQIL